MGLLLATLFTASACLPHSVAGFNGPIPRALENRVLENFSINASSSQEEWSEVFDVQWENFDPTLKLALDPSDPINHIDPLGLNMSDDFWDSVYEHGASDVQGFAQGAVKPITGLVQSAVHNSVMLATNPLGYAQEQVQHVQGVASGLGSLSVDTRAKVEGATRQEIKEWSDPNKVTGKIGGLTTGIELTLAGSAFAGPAAAEGTVARGTEMVEGVVAKAEGRAEGLVYRSGGHTPDTFTPRPGVDAEGLSTFDSLEAAVKPGGKAQIIDMSKVEKPLVGVSDAPPAGHVSIRPGAVLTDKVLADTAEWAATRGSDKIHPLTEKLMKARIGEIKRPK